MRVKGLGAARPSGTGSSSRTAAMAMGATLLILGMSQFSVLDTLTMAPPSSAAGEKVGAAGEVGGTEEVGVTGEEGKV